jgi:release factor glutamine methyltransferase
MTRGPRASVIRMNPTIAQALATAGLEPVDARVLLRHALGVDDAWLIAHDRDLLTSAQRDRFEAAVARRGAGEPVAYITGTREFFGLEFALTPAVLIPRPETELLVEWVLEHIAPDANARVLDLGTGSGCIAISVAHARPRARVMAIDCAAAAIEIARANAQRHRAINVEFREDDWFSALAGWRFELIVANPPYIAAGDPHLSAGDLRFEPAGALASGADGLDAIRLIVAAAPQYLQAGGWLVFEHGYDQAPRCRDLLARAGFAQVFSRADLAGIERISGGCLDATQRNR